MKHWNGITLYGLTALFFCVVPVICSADPGDILWSYECDDYISSSSPAIDSNGIIYTGSYDDSLYAISPTGERLWAVDLGGNIAMPPTIWNNDKLCCGTKYNTLYCLTLSGEVLWTYTLPDDPTNCAIRKDGTLLAGTIDGTVTQLDAGGTCLASFDCGSTLEQGPFIAADGSILCYTSEEAKIYNQQFQLRCSIDEVFETIPPAIVGNWIYLRRGFYGFCVYNTDGVLLATIHDFNSEYGTGNLVDEDGNLYVTAQYGYLVKYSSNGTYCWHYELGEQYEEVPVRDANGNVMVATSSDELICLDADGHLQWSTPLPSRCSSAPKVLDNGTIVVCCIDGQIVCIQGNNAPLAHYGYSCHGFDLANSNSCDTPLYIRQNTLSFPFALAGIPSVDTLFVHNGDTIPHTVELNEESPFFGAGLTGPPVLAPGDSLATEIVFFSAEPVEEEIFLTLRAQGSASSFVCKLKGHVRELENGVLLNHIEFPGNHRLSSSMLLGTRVITSTGEELIATDIDGNELWRRAFSTGPGSYISQPVGLGNGTFVCGSGWQIACYDSTGVLLWNVDDVDHPSLSADFDDYVYAVYDEFIVKLDASGVEQWRIDCGNNHSYTPISIAPDGTLYYANSACQVVALTPDGMVKHTTQLEHGCHQISIDAAGCVYTSSDIPAIIYRISPAGEVLASRTVYGSTYSPVLLDSTSLYCATVSGSGTRVYRYNKDDFVNTAISPAMNGSAMDELTLAANDRYFLTSYKNSPESYLYGRQHNGQPLWVFNPRENEMTGHMQGSPLILPNGNIVAGTRDSYGGANLFYILEDAVAKQDVWFTKGCNFLRNSCMPPQACTTADFNIKCDTLHFGNVPLDITQQKSLWLYNTGVEDLEVTCWVDSDIFSVVCPVNGTIPPQDSTLLVVNCLIPAAQTGIHETEVQIATNDPDFPHKSIHCNACSTLEGSLNWSLDTGFVSSPAIDGNGTIYLVNGNDLMAIWPHGEQKWITTLSRNYYVTDNVTITEDDSGILVSPAAMIDSTGTIIFNDFPGTYNTTEIALTSQQTFVCGSMSHDHPGIFCYNLDGIQTWQNTALHRMTDVPVVDENDRIYFQSFQNSMLGAFYCYDSDGNELWMQDVDTGVNSVTIGSNQRLYYLYEKYDYENHSVMVCTDYQGNVIWECEVPVGSSMPGTSVIIDAEENLYFGSMDGFLASVSPEGDVNWVYYTYSGIRSTPAVGANGCIYFGANDGALYALNPDGTLRWNYQTGASISTGITITPDGMIYCTNEAGKLYAIQGECGGLADSPWPMMHQNARHTNRLPHAFVTDSQQHTLPTPRITLANYPNPFNPSTEIRFQLSDVSQLEHAEIEIFNVKGQKVKAISINTNELSSRPQWRDLSSSITWDGTDSSGQPVASGLYLYRLVAGSKTLAQSKMMLLK